ncbi:MAG TPA: hypothetical protein VNG93_04740 [Candidatus Dormibacteraeota bacterium]|nr:hypothetical protein [Candidatus Dormibacteraeota bacterium]
MREALSGLDPLALLAVGTLVALGLLNLVAIGPAVLALHQGLAVLAGCVLLAVLNRSKVRTSQIVPHRWML